MSYSTSGDSERLLWVGNKSQFSEIKPYSGKSLSLDYVSVKQVKKNIEKNGAATILVPVSEVSCEELEQAQLLGNNLMKHHWHYRLIQRLCRDLYYRGPYFH